MIPIDRRVGRGIVRSVFGDVLVDFPLRALLFLHLALLDALHFFLPLLECGRHKLSFTPKCHPGKAGIVKPFTKKGKLPARLTRLPRRIAIIFIRKPVAPAAALAPAATAARSASPARTTKALWPSRSTFALWACFVDLQIAPANFFSVQRRHGLRRFRVVRHFHERKAARAARLPVHGHVDPCHLAERRKQLAQFAFGGLKIHVADEQTLHLDSPCTLRSTTSAGLRQTAVSRTLGDVDLNWLKSVQGGPQSAPSKELRQSCFRSLPNDINTLLCEAPNAHFGPAVAAGQERPLND